MPARRPRSDPPSGQTSPASPTTREHQRLHEPFTGVVAPWRRWGPYVAERSWANVRKFQEDPHWRDHLLFYEYFHGDNGQGLGASHQPGWTALIAYVIDEWRR